MGNLILNNKLLVILGPTATGKTDLALKLAKEFSGELISADSRQVYKGLNIGTGKIPSGISKYQITIYKKEKYWKINGIKVWMYDVADPKRQYNVSCFVKGANKIIDDVYKKGKLPILVGGTGLYIKALIDGLNILNVPINKSLRRELEKLSLFQLQKRLQLTSLERWNILNYSDKQNPRRLTRSIEIVSMQPSIQSQKSKYLSKKYNVLKIGLTASRDILYEKVDQSVNARLNSGMIEEVRNLNENGLSLKRMKQLGLEYGILADYISGKILKEDLAGILKGKIHGYVRRQLTYFKKEKEINWFDITESKTLNKIEKLIHFWYDSGKDIYAKKN